jgi:hypothetical protein
LQENPSTNRQFRQITILAEAENFLFAGSLVILHGRLDIAAHKHIAARKL